ncbi:integration host factor subunit alpha [Haemophilus sputorum]|jgi:integration host factor, alpha subunit|uniref:Integration host factor subunit alpha n=1 Tax=Haemophilus sputorum TaxID=1078480 RepID=A0A369YJ14_9PAST|nr:integration host factor subunit alpha [Haemophilus sputorum]EJP29230.1 integration host factor, alpha subunit [Haemophilus sputorum HK 2154]MCQ1856905.1 integration host factor subunit alpha [Haemophilus sputorum]RDE73007.1 integration host factor subunit alpha [Haemophilus sputorum]RDF09198.1 integration host factor subunit alpha [Haemophilus sputorum]RDF12528.1 integration host factor subunit alpha [Haemophilus sputorum]
MALTKVELAEALVAKGFDKAQAKDFVEQFFNEIRNALASGKEVKLSGFGNFQLREKKARPGRNPKTGEEVSISARRVVTFKASPKMRERVSAFKAKN